MRGVDTFHLGDEYYVYVNWDVEVDSKGGTECHIWVGDSFDNPLIICGVPMTGYEYMVPLYTTTEGHTNSILARARENMAKLLAKHRQELTEYIKN